MAKGCVTKNSGAAYIRRDSSMPSPFSCTYAFWFKFITIRDAYNTIFNLHWPNTGEDYYYKIGVTNNADGNRLQLATKDGAWSETAYGGSPATNTWYYYALSCQDPVGADKLSLRRWNTSGVLLDELLLDSRNFSVQRVQLGNGPVGSVYSNCRIGGFRAWNGVGLTLAELKKEFHNSVPVRTQFLQLSFEDNPASDPWGWGLPFTINGTTVINTDWAPTYTTRAALIF